MTLRGTVKAVARALGVWRERHELVDITGLSEPWPPGALVIKSLSDGDLTVFVGGRKFGDLGRRHDRIDDLTAALLLLGHARGLRVDLGECPACVARSGKRDGRLVLAMREWAHDREDNVGSTHGYRSTRWSARSLSSDGRWIDYPGRPGGLILLTRPCPACTVDGKPSGRHTIPWALALLGVVLCRTNLAVLADKMQGPGDPLGLWLAAWLGGPCRACDGTATICGCDRGDYIEGAGCGACHNTGQLALDPCRVCYGHGTLLGEHEPDMLAALDPLAWITDRPPTVGDRRLRAEANATAPDGGQLVLL